MAAVSPVLGVLISRAQGDRVDISTDVSTDNWLRIWRLVLDGNVDIATRSDQQIDDLFDIGKAAMYLQIQIIVEIVEGRLLRELTSFTCVRLLVGSMGSGMLGVEKAARSLALDDFGEISTTDDFKRLPYELLISLISDGALQAIEEEVVLGAVNSWIEYQAHVDTDTIAHLFANLRMPRMDPTTVAKLAARSDLQATPSVMGMIRETALFHYLPEDMKGLVPLDALLPRAFDARRGVGLVASVSSKRIEKQETLEAG